MKNSIYDITRFTTTDFKDHLSCVVWFTSCNMRCLYCYNEDIVKCKDGNYSLEDLFLFLEKRVGLLEAVVLSGGEASGHDLLEICKKIKNLGFKIKLDTNGSRPKLVKNLLNENLLDFISLDFKANKSKFQDITKSNFYEEFLETLEVLLKSSIDFEVRTTLHTDLLNEEDINEMIEVLVNKGYKKDFYIQNFLAVPNIGNLEEQKSLFDKSRLSDSLNIVFRN